MKTVKTFCYALGGYYAASSLLAYMVLGMQASLYSMTGDKQMNRMGEWIEKLQLEMFYMAPYMVAVGLLYIAYGLFFEKIKSGKLMLFILLGVATLVVMVMQIMNIFPAMDSFLTGLPGYNQEINDFTNMLMIVGLVFGIAQVVIPQFFLARMIYKMEMDAKDFANS
ncbi:MAG: hypothetical protein ACOZCO_15130 [Bacteroidota bacterium]